MKDAYVKIWDGTVVVDTELSDMVMRLVAEDIEQDIVVSEIIFTSDCPAVEVFFDDQATDIVVWWD